MSSTSPQNEMEKKKQETVPQGGLYALDEAEGINYGLLLRPIDVKNERLNIDLRSIFSVSGSDVDAAKQAVEDATDENKQAAEERLKQAVQEEKDREKKKVDGFKKLENSFSGDNFQANLLRAEDITSGKYILLPLPRDIRDSLSVNYSTANLGTLMAGIQLGSDLQKQIQGEGSVSDSASALGNYIVRAAIDLLPGAAGAATALSGQVLNPYTQTVFENVELRTFNFEFVFQPKNQKESENIREIINTIRYYALPETVGMMLNVPWYWELAFYGSTASYLHAFSRCVLSRMDVNFSQDGFPVFTTADAPKTVVLTLEFKEVFPLNKKVITNFNNPSMTPSSASYFADPNNLGNNETEQQTNPEDGTPAQQQDNAEQELKREIASKQSEYNTALQKIKELEQYVNRTDITAKQREDAILEMGIQSKQLATLGAIINQKVTELNG